MIRMPGLFLLFLIFPAWAGEPVWIDVRTPQEFQQGHLEGAHHIPFDQIETGILGVDAARDDPIYLYCAVGGRAEKARESLVRRGYTNVTNVGSLENARKVSAGLKR